MARIEYADPSAGPARDLATRIIAERGSLLHLYRMLLHSPPVAAGWLEYLSAIRHHTRLDAAVRETIIIRIAHLNRAPYEADQHIPIALRAGIGAEQIASLAQPVPDETLFDRRQQAVLAYTDAMTRDIQVPDAVFDAVHAQFPEDQVVELTATIAAYNMVSRFLEALQVHTSDTPQDPPVHG